MFGASLGMGILYAGNGAAARQAGRQDDTGSCAQTDEPQPLRGRAAAKDRQTSQLGLCTCMYSTSDLPVVHWF